MHGEKSWHSGHCLDVATFSCPRSFVKCDDKSFLCCIALMNTHVKYVCV